MDVNRLRGSFEHHSGRLNGPFCRFTARTPLGTKKIGNRNEYERRRKKIKRRRKRKRKWQWWRMVSRGGRRRKSETGVGGASISVEKKRFGRMESGRRKRQRSLHAGITLR